MGGRYTILVFFTFITYLHADIGSECMDIEKKYYEKGQKSINCNITEYTEDDDKSRCIEKKYTNFVNDIDDLFLKILGEIEEDELDFDLANTKDICSSLKPRIIAIFQGNDGEKKKEELDKAQNEMKEKYRSKLLSSLVLIPIEVPKKCVPSLKTYLNKSVNLKQSRFIEITKKSYYECLDRNILTKRKEDITELKEREISKKEDTALSTDLGKEVSQGEDSYGLAVDIKQDVAQHTDMNNIPKSSEQYKDIGEDLNENSNTTFTETESQRVIRQRVIQLCENIETDYSQTCSTHKCIEENVKKFDQNIVGILKEFDTVPYLEINQQYRCFSLVDRLNILNRKSLSKKEYLFNKGHYRKKENERYKNFLILKRKNKINSREKTFGVYLFRLRENPNPKLPKKLGNRCSTYVEDEFTVGQCNSVTQQEFDELKSIKDFSGAKKIKE